MANGSTWPRKSAKNQVKQVCAGAGSWECRSPALRKVGARRLGDRLAKFNPKHGTLKFHLAKSPTNFANKSQALQGQLPRTRENNNERRCTEKNTHQIKDNDSKYTNTEIQIQLAGEQVSGVKCESEGASLEVRRLRAPNFGPSQAPGSEPESPLLSKSAACRRQVNTNVDTQNTRNTQKNTRNTHTKLTSVEWRWLWEKLKISLVTFLRGHELWLSAQNGNHFGFFAASFGWQIFAACPTILKFTLARWPLFTRL
uniref:HDC12757 n=1 Tax=Drosophila melanogaster TaxID=7227 RepID=Q6IKE0_DROME|nr:TPA_inf: HDC12757 [Drosophila melanogaster]